MSNETEKPLAGVLRAVNILDGPHEEDERVCECTLCRTSANIIARESGLAKLVEAVEQAEETRHCDYLMTGDSGEITRQAVIAEEDWNRVVAAARRVREGE